MKKIISILAAVSVALSSAANVMAAGMGVGTHFDHSYPIEENLEKAVGAEVQWIRDISSWMGVEQTKGVLQIKEHNMNAFKRIEEEGINLLCGLGYGNTLYTPESKFVLPTKDNPEYYDAFLNYVEYQLKELKDYVDAWEVWNEPNWSTFNYYGTSGTEYAKLYLDCAKLIRKYDPTAKLVCGVVMGYTGSNLQYGKDIFAYLKSQGDVNEMMDVFSIHKYTNDVETEYVKALNTWEGVFDTYGYTGDVWMTENGASSHTNPQNEQYSPLTEDEQATYIARYGVQWERYLMENNRNGEVFWYDLTNDGTSSTEIEDNYGLVDSDYEPKPAYYAAKLYNNLTNNKKMVKYTENGTGYVAQYSDGVDITYIIYGAPGTQSVALSGDIAYVYDYIGNLVETIENPDGTKTVEVTGTPVYIECVSNSLKFTNLKYIDNRNVLEIAGFAPNAERVTITLEKDGNVIKSLSAKVNNDDAFKKTISMDVDGDYVVNVTDGTNSVQSEVDVRKNPSENVVGEIEDSVVIYDTETNKVTVNTKLEDSVDGELVSVAVIPANKDISKLTSADFEYIGETASASDGLISKTFTLPSDVKGEYKIVLGRNGLKTPNTNGMFFAGTWNYAYVSSLDTSEENGDIKVLASVSNYTDSPKTISVVVAEYTSGNTLVKVTEIYDTLEAGERENYSKSITKNSNTSYYKTFAWDSMSGMIPLYDVK